VPHLNTRRAAAGLLTGLATCAATLVAAPAALAAPTPLPAPVLSATTVLPGQPFTLRFAGCLPDRAGAPSTGIYYSSTDEDPYFGNGAEAFPDGSYTFTEQFRPGTPSGAYTIQGVCDRYTTSQAYPPVTVTLAASAPTPPSVPTDPKPGKGKGRDKGKGKGTGGTRGPAAADVCAVGRPC